MSRVRSPSIAHFLIPCRREILTFFQALILGLVQGLTEFLPVSSSAHLRIAKWFLGMNDGEHLLYFDLLCHTGTLLALLIYLRKDIWSTLIAPRKIGLFTCALAPLVPAYFLLKPLRLAASDPAYLGYFLWITAALLFAAARNSPRKAPKTEVIKWRDVLCIGVMQTMALIPGISRSGSTISAARFCGWEWREAARFSYLLAIPTILGGQLLETLKLLGGPREAIDSIPSLCYAIGFLSALGLGLLSVRLIFWIYEKGNIRPLAWYCLAAGLFAWTIFHNG